MTTFTRATCASVVLTILSAAAVHAQATTGSLQGTVYDSLTSRPLAGATVEVSGTTQLAITDKQGRFRIDSLSPGAHRVSFSASELDSIGLFGFARDVQIRANAVERVSLSTPSFRTMYTQLCAPIAKSVRDSAIVFGTVTNAATGERVDSAHVQFSWFGVVTDASGVRVQEMSREAKTGSGGDYGMCGLPSDLGLSTRAFTPTAASGSVQTNIGDARIVRVDLAVSTELHEDANLQPSSERVSARPRGQSTVRGAVRDERGKPLTNALVVLSAADTAVRTDDAGRYQIGNAPSGTQQLEVRQIGLGAVSRVVQLESGKATEVNFVLSPATVLSAVNVRSDRIGVDQSEYLRRRKSGFGQILEEKEISKRFDIGSALSRVPGINVVRSGMGSFSVINTRAQCPPLIVVDGVPEMMARNSPTIPIPGGTSMPTTETALTRLNPKDVIAIEFYPSVAGLPMQYVPGKMPECGMLLVWTKASRW